MKMKLKFQKTRLATVLKGSALLGAVAVSAPSQSLEFQYDEWKLNVDTTLGYSAQWRVENRDDNLEAAFNNNDGNNNFDDGSMTSSKANIILEVGGSREDFSFFIRGDAMYDYIYEDVTSDMSKDNYLTYNDGIPVGGDVKRGDYPDGTLDKHGKRVRLLDAFAKYNLALGDQDGSIKAGRQIISWGGSLFYPGINGLQNPVDAAAALAPGVETKEIFLPTEAIDLKWNFNGNISAEAYIKLGWKETLQPGVGSYLSTVDYFGPGAQRILLGPLGSGKSNGSNTPGNASDQWGTAVRYMFDSGWNVELAYAKSHANIPGAFTFIDLSGPGSYIEEIYAEDIPSWNIAVSGNLGEAEIYADVFYSDDTPFVDQTEEFIFDGDNVGLIRSKVVRDDYWQVTVGMSDLYTAFKWLSPSIAFNAEVLYQGNNLGENDLVAPWTVTDDAWGYQFALTPRYFNVIQGMDGTISLAFRHDVHGYGNAIALGNGLEEDQKKASITATGNYLGKWEFKATYAVFWDEKEKGDYLIKDRDNLSFSAKYRF